MNCTVASCPNPVLVKSLGLCHKHYARFKRTGSTDDPAPRRKFCTQPGCSEPVHGNGLCAKHWMRQRRHGDPTARLRQRDEGTADVRWMAKVRVESPGCWVWTAGTTGASGYGAYEGTTAHLYIWRLLVGPVPEGMQLDHLCRNRKCCNPDHLEPVDRLENIRRGTVGKSAYRPEDVRAKHAAYMREYMRRRRIAKPETTLND